ncbi:M48 family metalloprotease [Natronosporangium hydrolyticum]|uniref:M48 family metalloprotease n=1 Tax=Natronosporangium hydrolyticum TaxID=2811111 RepID=A0A895YMP2_9ACTN|nr:M48 family metallopeptidase [Natronosporangium hydrolyticum]QSB15370.1 M48 family metalloprotease [Natronosporangium hydrolyticum]
MPESPADTVAAPDHHDTASCPECGSPLAALRHAQWCPGCEWGLYRFAPERQPAVFGWRWLDRWAHRVAFTLNGRMFRALSGGELRPTTVTPARASVIAASVVLLAAVAAMFVGGVLLIVADFPSLTIVPGLLLVLLALVLRPRFGKLDPLLASLSRNDAPTLFDLIDRVADATGAPRPQVIGVHREVNAAAGAVGVRRRRVLSLGLPLWVQLTPQEQVALIAHELGHFANGDVRRGPLTQPALLTLGTAARVLLPNPADLARAGNPLLYLVTLIIHLIQGLIARALWTAQLVLLWLGLRDTQRAEYLADDRATAVAGSTAARGLMDALVTSDTVAAMVARAARESDEVPRWRAAAAASRQRLADQVPLRHQLSLVDDASLFATHPPTGWRRRMIEARPWRDPAIVLTEHQSAQIDAELAKHYARARRDIGAITVAW